MRLILIAGLLSTIGCGDKHQTPKREAIDNKEIVETIEEVKEAEKIEEIIIPPAPSPYPAIGYPIPGGGGGHRRRLPCEDGTSDCDDDNPCTIDSCNDEDQCENTFDDSKSEFGSCESDGSSCTVGKCVAIDDAVVCHEQRREFITGELGCADDDVCTSDSCIETDLGIRSSVDDIGNIIPDNSYQCVQEIVNGLTCFIEDSCLPGICQVMGSGMPDDGFSLQCVPNEGAIAQSFCPDTDNNQCTQARCDIEEGCVIENVADDTPCDDHNPCSQNDTCQSGICIGEADACSEGLDEFCQIGFCDAAGGCSSIDRTGPYGDACTTTYPGICEEGRFMCLEGELTDMCEPLIRPGDKNEICGDEGDVDENCSGSIDDPGCDCPMPTGEFTTRYVDPDGDNTGDCSDENTPCLSISYAIAQASPGDLISLAEGTFLEENITVDKNLFIVGQGADVTIVDAADEPDGSRVFIVNASITATFCGLRITGGSAAEISGGGMVIGGSADVRIFNADISGNTAGADGGGIYSNGVTLAIFNSTISGNTAGTDGGGIYNNGVTLAIFNSTISGNTVNNSGGGIANFNTTNITNSTISGNTANNSGGGVANFNTTNITSSTISGNTANNSGGGIFNFSLCTTTIINSTISGNEANNGAGGISSSIDTITNITNSTIYGDPMVPNGQQLLKILASGTINVAHTVVYSGGMSECSSTITDNGFNIEGGMSCGFTTMGSKQSTDPELGPLQDNGGLTQTHALLPMSPAIDMGAADCGDMSITTDQRGLPRPVGSSCDIGAFEVQQ